MHMAGGAMFGMGHKILPIPITSLLNWSQPNPADWAGRSFVPFQKLLPAPGGGVRIRLSGPAHCQTQTWKHQADSSTVQDSELSGSCLTINWLLDHPWDSPDTHVVFRCPQAPGPWDGGASPPLFPWSGPYTLGCLKVWVLPRSLQPSIFKCFTLWPVWQHTIVHLE